LKYPLSLFHQNDCNPPKNRLRIGQSPDNLHKSLKRQQNRSFLAVKLLVVLLKRHFKKQKFDKLDLAEKVEAFLAYGKPPGGSIQNQRNNRGDGCADGGA
jgi:hypothetical protein